MRLFDLIDRIVHQVVPLTLHVHPETTISEAARQACKHASLSRRHISLHFRGHKFKVKPINPLASQTEHLEFHRRVVELIGAIAH